MSKLVGRRATTEDTRGPDRGSTASTPRWVKVFVVTFIVLVLVFVILHLTGNGFGDHMHMSVIEHGGQLL